MGPRTEDRQRSAAVVVGVATAMMAVMWPFLMAMMTTTTTTTAAMSVVEMEVEGVRGKDDEDHGFTLFFRSNREEMLDAPIHFNPPLPSWLTGTLVRNGLGLFENGDRTFMHAFDGFAKLSSWRFQGNGSAYFSTRFLASSFYNESMASETIAPYLLFQGPQPSFNLFERFQALLRGLDNMNVNVYRLPSDSGDGEHDYLALSDYWKAYTFSPRTLATGPSVLGKLKGEHGQLESTSFLDLLSSAHPLPEPGTRHHLTFLSSVSLFPFTPDQVHLVRVKSTSEREVVASWGVPRVPYMHSFSVTQTHALLVAHPFYVNVMCMVREAMPFNCLDWEEGAPSALYVVELSSGRVRQLAMENVFTMHHVNAYDDGEGRIVMDISAYPDPSFVGNLRMEVLMDPVRRNSFPAQAQLKRFVVDLGLGTVTRLEVAPPSPSFIANLDMPTMNECYRSRRYCYVYGLVLKTDNVSLSAVAIVKRDVCGTGGDRSWIVPHHYPVEPFFVPRPGGVAEDDGVVLVPMIDGPAERSYMAVLDARDLTLLSSAYLPTFVPYSLHGHFFSEVH